MCIMYIHMGGGFCHSTFHTNAYKKRFSPHFDRCNLQATRWLDKTISLNIEKMTSNQRGNEIKPAEQIFCGNCISHHQLFVWCMMHVVRKIPLSLHAPTKMVFFSMFLKIRISRISFDRSSLYNKPIIFTRFEFF